MTTTATTAATARKTAKTALFMAVFSLACHWAIVPVAAWNHSLALVIIAALAPMVVINVMRKQGKYPAYVNTQRSHVKSIMWLVVKTAIAAFFFWNHLWIVAIVAIFLMSIHKNPNKSK